MRNGKKRNCCNFATRLKNCFGTGECQGQITRLSQRARTGRVKVCKINGDRKICARMAAMGVYPGVEADIVSPENGSQCLLKVNGGTISLDSTISDNILVTAL